MFSSCNKNSFSFRAFAKKEPGGVIAAGTYYGSAVLEKIQSPRLSVYGSLLLEKSTVGQVHIRGNALLSTSTITESLDVYGNVELNNVTLQGQSVIYGTMHATESAITEDIAVNGRIFAQHTQFADITVEKKSTDVTSLHQYDIELRNKTHVQNIEFFGEEGIIFCDATSSIDGEVVNARLMKDAK